jgi:hypothetical protein
MAEGGSFLYTHLCKTGGLLPFPLELRGITQYELMIMKVTGIIAVLSAHYERIHLGNHTGIDFALPIQTSRRWAKNRNVRIEFNDRQL